MTPPVLSNSRTAEMQVKNTAFLLDRLGRDCHQLQFLRELTQNSIEAIGKTGSPGEIVWDLDWNTFDLDQTRKLCVVDTGVGMTGEELVQYINRLSSSGGEQSIDGNYGVGAKIAAATRNHEGVIYLSWKNGSGSMIHLWRDPKTEVYGLKVFEGDDGNWREWLPITDEVKPEIIRQNGTAVVLLGNSAKENTMAAPEGVPAPSRWIAKYLNTRYFVLPKGITLKVREGWEHPRQDTQRNKLRTIKGQRDYLDSHSVVAGKCDLPEGIVHWWILKDDPSLTQESNYIESSGHIAALHGNELYEMATGRSGSARLQEFGVIFGGRYVVLYLQPRETASNRVTTNTARTQLLVNSKPLAWSDWAEEFRASMPAELKSFIDAKSANLDDKDNAKTIRDRLKTILHLFNVTRYKPSERGSINISDPEENTGGELGGDNGDDSNSSGDPRPKKPRSPIGNVYSLFTKKRGVTGDKVTTDVIPDVKWISTKDGSRNPKDLEDRAARFLASQNLLLVNRDFRVFTDMIEIWSKEFGNRPELQKTIESVVKAWFEQALVETIIGVQALRNSKEWLIGDIESANSEIALTAAVMQRYHVNNAIKRELMAKFKAIHGAS